MSKRRRWASSPIRTFILCPDAVRLADGWRSQGMFLASGRRSSPSQNPRCPGRASPSLRGGPLYTSFDSLPQHGDTIVISRDARVPSDYVDFVAEVGHDPDAVSSAWSEPAFIMRSHPGGLRCAPPEIGYLRPVIRSRYMRSVTANKQVPERSI